MEIQLSENHQQDEQKAQKQSLNFKTPFCQHKRGCLQNCLLGGFDAFKKAFLAKLCLNTLFTLLSLRKILKGSSRVKELILSLVNSFFFLQRTNFKLGLFLGLQTFLLKSIQCILRILRKKEDGWNAFISGAISGGISITTQEEKIRYNVRVYLFGRAVDCIYQSCIQKGYIPNSQWTAQIVFSMMSMIIAYGYFFEPEYIPYDTYKFYNNFAACSTNEKIWHLINVQAQRNKMMERGLK